jgi:hypothetical protein
VAGVRANWHVGDLDLDAGGDPMQEIAMLRSSAEVIDLSKTEPELHDELKELVDREAAYWLYSKDDDGKNRLSCSLKWSDRHVLVNPDAAISCFNCPHYVDNVDSARSLICSLGRRQHELVEMARSFAVAETLEAELCAAFERDIEESASLAEAALACL